MQFDVTGHLGFVSGYVMWFHSLQPINDIFLVFQVRNSRNIVVIYLHSLFYCESGCRPVQTECWWLKWNTPWWYLGRSQSWYDVFGGNLWCWLLAYWLRYLLCWGGSCKSCIPEGMSCLCKLIQQFCFSDGASNLG